MVGSECLFGTSAPLRECHPTAPGHADPLLRNVTACHPTSNRLSLRSRCPLCSLWLNFILLRLVVAADGDVPQPVLVVALGEIGSDVATPGLLALAHGADHQAGNGRACSAAPIRWNARTVRRARNGTSGRRSRPLPQTFAVAANTHAPPHQALERVADVGQVEKLGERDARAGFPAGERENCHRFPAASPRRSFTRRAPVNQGFQQTVGGQPVGPVQTAGGDFAGRPEPGHAWCGPGRRRSPRPSCNGRRAARGCGRG